MLYFSKTARNFLTILTLHKVDNISFQMSLGSHLAALVWQTGVHRNVARNKDVIWRNLLRSWHDITKFDVIFFKNGSRFRHITSLFLATFLWTPVCQTSAAKWLPRLIWKEILSTLCRVSIVKKFWAVFEKYNIKLSCVMSASDQISPYHLFISRYVCMNASLSNQRG